MNQLHEAILLGQEALNIKNGHEAAASAIVALQFIVDAYNEQKSQSREDESHIFIDLSKDDLEACEAHLRKAVDEYENDWLAEDDADEQEEISDLAEEAERLADIFQDALLNLEDYEADTDLEGVELGESGGG